MICHWITQAGLWICIRIESAFLESLDPHLHFLESLDPDPHFDPDRKYFLKTIFHTKNSVFLEKIKPWIRIQIRKCFKPWIWIRIEWMQSRNPAHKDLDPKPFPQRSGSETTFKVGFGTEFASVMTPRVGSGSVMTRLVVS